MLGNGVCGNGRKLLDTGHDLSYWVLARIPYQTQPGISGRLKYKSAVVSKSTLPNMLRLIYLHAAEPIPGIRKRRRSFVV